ncbi:hypothetical protein [Streptomyces sp. NPDC101234]
MDAAWEGDSLAGALTAKVSSVSCAGFVAAVGRVLCTDVVRQTQR